MALNYLDFDYCEDEQGWGTFDAVASTQAPQVAAVQAEIAQVLDWAHTAFPNLRAPLDEGGEWDFNLQGQQEWSAHEVLHYHPQTHQFSSHLNPAGPARHTVTLSLSGSVQFCDALRQQFGLD
jgi:hypothetical protein